MWHLMVAAEKYLDKNQTIIITQTPDNENSGITYQALSKIETDGKSEYELELKYFLSIGTAKTRAVAKVTYDGKKYVMDLRYYLFDYYDWEEAQRYPIGLITAEQMYKLCRCGNSKFYENWGIYETQIMWEATDESRNKAIEEEKEKMEQR